MGALTFLYLNDWCQGEIMTSTGTSTFAFLGPFLHKKILNIVFSDWVGIKTNIIQTGFNVNEWTFIIIIVISEWF